MNREQRQVPKRPEKSMSELLEEFRLSSDPARQVELAMKMLISNRKAVQFDDSIAVDLIESLMNNALYYKTGEIKDYEKATRTLKFIIRQDPGNAIALYRLGFIYYTTQEWLGAAEHFRQALNHRDHDFYPLAEDQIIKADLFIGMCGLRLAERSLYRAQSRYDQDDSYDGHEGISVERLLDEVQSRLARVELRVVSNEEKGTMSRLEFDELIEDTKRETLLLSYVGQGPVVNWKGAEQVLPIQSANLLGQLLVLKGEPLSFGQAERDAELFARSGRLTPSNYRQMVTRLNRKLDDTGVSPEFRIRSAGDRTYRMPQVNFIIIAEDDQFLPFL